MAKDPIGSFEPMEGFKPEKPKCHGSYLALSSLFGFPVPQSKELIHKVGNKFKSGVLLSSVFASVKDHIGDSYIP